VRVVSPNAVSLTGLTKTFGEVTAVDDLSVEIGQGEVVAFLGPNGAGKTTTIDMILGFQRPDAGEVAVLGRTPAQAIARGEVAAVMQTGGLLKDLTVGETVTLVSTLFRESRPVAEVLERAGITEIAGRRVDKCSGGEQQRLRFAIALLSDPELMLLDEPTTGMDVEGRREFWAAIRQDAQRGRTVMFATHYLDEADSYADRIILIRQGQIVADGTTAAIKNLAAGRIVRATLPGADEAELASWPGVDSAEVRGDSVYLHSKDSDTVARHLLESTPAHDLEITSHNLEDAFLALTSKDAPGAPRKDAS
jgi:ABC-2 type transport system ATP-binding protein